MLKLRDNYIREKFDKKKEWKHINEDQYILQNCDEKILYKIENDCSYFNVCFVVSYNEEAKVSNGICERN